MWIFIIISYKFVTLFTPFQVRVTDVMDHSIADVKVTAKSVTSASGDVIAENKDLTKGPEE